ncbi:MAG TPA: ribonucleoside-diphosphate reductase subunit alpha [Candidatus Acidoferrales bacterium]|nr:ribonucleoside-diphosphate reductase subunit alpha [Candidatus Acidoferrales bacterium]
MQTDILAPSSTVRPSSLYNPVPPSTPPAQAVSTLRVIRRNGELTAFDADKIAVALGKAFLAVENGSGQTPQRIHEIAAELTAQVVASLHRRLPPGGTVHIEEIQDQAELALMRAGHHKVARAYVLYREERARQRQALQSAMTAPAAGPRVIMADGRCVPLPLEQLEATVARACTGLAHAEPAPILAELRRNLYDGMPMAEMGQALVMSARSLIEQDPDYSRVAARLLLDVLRREATEVLGLTNETASSKEWYADYFRSYLARGVQAQRLDPRLLEFDLATLSAALEPVRDLDFTYLGLQTLYDRYLLDLDGRRFELPQAFFMRVAMGLALNEVEREARAIEFYQLLSSFAFMSSTPTLFNAGTLRPQLSSCYLTTVPDDLDGIFGAIRDNALLSKYAGGLGNDWTRVRGLGAIIKGTHGKSQGVVPFLKVANDTAVAVNQGGKRKGAVCAYLETWHIDIEEFIELRKNTGDERRRTHDMNTAHWIPDLFMRRVCEGGDWTLFSPDETPDLHDLVGADFEARYLEYEQLAAAGRMRLHKRLPAVQLWRRMLSMLFETGHPWITFKDTCNLRYTNAHQGRVHSSNLCTEITLHTSDAEIAVCNLGSVNLAAHVNGAGLDEEKLARTIATAVRMLDNVIDINWYSVPQARRSNLRHRPVGLGIMGFQDALHQLGIAYASPAAVEFADRSMELISYHAIAASSNLAVERGRYPSFEGSLWSQGILPIDSLERLAQTRGETLEVDLSTTLDWASLREQVRRQGMRNGNVLAIAPTATIANICGVSASIEPTFQNLFVKSNLSGEFTVVNPYLVRELQALGLWDAVMINDLKYYDGSLAPIARVPAELKARYACAFEIDPVWLVEAAARRQKWLDQAQSLNLYVAEASGPKLDALYKLAWRRGLKTTYYLRTRGATHLEKAAPASEAALLCAIDNPDCEACQ